MRILIIITVGIFFVICQAYRDCGKFNLKSKFAKEHECKVLNNTKITDGFAPYNLTTITCERNIKPDIIFQATCLSKCKYPGSKSTLSRRKYKPEEISACTAYEIRKGGIAHKFIKQVFACRCVKKQRKSGRKSEKKTKKRYKKSSKNN